MESLEEVMTKHLEHAARKHALGEDYVEKSINRMSQYQFMQALSEAFEEMKTQGYFK